MKRIWISAILFAGLSLCAPQFVFGQGAATSPIPPAAVRPFTYYIDPSQVDLAHLLSPPPPDGSPVALAELKAVLDAQKTRTEVQTKRAQDDDTASVFRFADVMGPNFKQNNLPYAAEFFRQASSDGLKAIGAAKNHFQRARPYDVSKEVQPIVEHKPGGSYPSGHAAFAYLNAILLADMVPEKSAAIFDRAADFSNNRIIAGVHYSSDLDAGRIAASVAGNILLHNARFMTDYATARAEVRKALGLPEQPISTDATRR